jgi:hypothetical protein
MRAVRIAVAGVFGVAMGAGWLVACGGGSSSNSTPMNDASPDSTAMGSPDTGSPDGGGDAGSCAPPTDPTKAALCVTLTAEAVNFLANDPHFDGKGVLRFAVLGAADGGATVADPVVFPSADAGEEAGLVDLSQPLPTVRFDGLPPTTVFPQAIFVDDVALSAATGSLTPGWWLGGYDLSKGVANALLSAVPLSAGESKTVTLNLRALRELLVTVTAAVTPAGNGQGPMNVLVVQTDQVGSDAGNVAWGFGTTPCANVVADGGAVAVAFFVGPGPYFTLPVLDDFARGGDFPPGAMTSLDPDAGLTIPAANQFTAGNAYVKAQSVALTYVNAAPDGSVDDAACGH